MAYDKAKMFKVAKTAITENNLYSIEDIVAYMPCVKSTFYDLFPLDSNESNELKELLDKNKIKTKKEIRDKLFKGDKAAELIALYKLICTDDERRALSMQEVKHTGQLTVMGIEYIIPNEDKTKPDL